MQFISISVILASLSAIVASSPIVLPASAAGSAPLSPNITVTGDVPAKHGNILSSRVDDHVNDEPIGDYNDQDSSLSAIDEMIDALDVDGMPAPGAPTSNLINSTTSTKPFKSATVKRFGRKKAVHNPRAVDADAADEPLADWNDDGTDDPAIDEMMDALDVDQSQASVFPERLSTIPAVPTHTRS
ncbi:hypothetical protein PUNSTDRAFT_43530 [Punctularia strigosozonata HHB-11173 SS5]|uniref:uncharacterized protein n=1 Tax=Punctularia strigosozonata (strain HHB-11173) TaxID=741275 RepID=UPI00044164FA|nr:uncharacterized protein PUNSTDRAFT_43530 [Punctularia strigosozonata HHB-11173 SS5]EIN10721.1 hypothetical protein PUNSTDRAFT_43530 [Punctularia strigosozonata HHB-11173 SS5]